MSIDAMNACFVSQSLLVMVIALSMPFGYTWSTNGKEGAKE